MAAELLACKVQRRRFGHPVKRYEAGEVETERWRVGEEIDVCLQKIRWVAVVRAELEVTEKEKEVGCCHYSLLHHCRLLR